MPSLVHVYYVLAYSQRRGLLSLDELADPAAALKRRFQLEGQADANTEVVVLSADSLQALEQTHARYFLTAAELARAGAELLS